MSRLPLIARVYIVAVILAAPVLVVSLLAWWWPVLVSHIGVIALAGGAAALAVLKPIGRNRIFYTVTTVIHVFAMVSFPAPVAVAVRVVEGGAFAVLGHMSVHSRLFNAAQGILTTGIAVAVYASLSEGQVEILSSPQDYGALAVAGLVYFGVNTGLVSLGFALARRISFFTAWRTNHAGLFLYYFAMFPSGAVLAVLWQERPLMVPLAAVIVIMTHRALNVPNLEEEARTDFKTGLYNISHFNKVLDNELNRAIRHGRLLAVIMADLDNLREINNAHGHLAGDAVLQGVANIIRGSVRNFDVPARFGGEEFTLLLPETDQQEALAVAERIRSATEKASFQVATGDIPVSATISLGVAVFPTHARTANELLHRADTAMYDAKMRGRNQVCLAALDKAQNGDVARHAMAG